MKLALTLGGTDQGRSGIGVYARAIIPRLIHALRARGDEALVIGTPTEMQAYDDVLRGAQRRTIPQLYSNPLPNALFHMVGAAFIAKRSGASVLLLPAANRRLVFSSSIPTVAVVHDLAQLHVANKYDSIRMTYFRFFLTPALAHATRLVAVSNATRKDILTIVERPASEVRVIPHGVDAARFAPPTVAGERIRKARALLKLNTPYVLYLARLEHPGKNHLRLIEAFAKSRLAAKHSLVLAGADWGALPLIRKSIARFGIESRVVISGFVPDEFTPGLIAGADAIAMVGLHEGFGLPALEALAAGRPLFIAQSGALKEVTADLAKSCDPLDVDSIRAALEHVLYDEPFRRRALEAGPAFANRYDWDASVEALLSVCDDAANGEIATSQRSAERSA